MTNPLLTHYPAAQSRYDEMFDEGLQPRPHWQALLNQLSSEPVDVMTRRVDAMQRQVQENGVAYNVYADPEGVQRPWDLSVLPFILPHHEWVEIEAAVQQRATLLNKILVDIYGDQTMLGEGLLPAALIHGNSGFLRTCHGIRQRDDIALHFYAVDLARAPDGRWWVEGDRTQAPSGAGYALENRTVISRAFPELFRDLKVQRLASFFATLRDSLTTWARQYATRSADGQHQAPPPGDNEQPLIVLLTPGSYNETYHEQTYLARYLGFPLVEGSDLTVRKGIVWLKTVAGPRRVHVILRRVDDDFCDPLELRSDSALGVAGLTEAARRGNVLIANGLGSNMLESGALLGYLPELCRRLLDQPLKMPSVATWWCGEPAALEQVIANLDELIVKPAFPQIRSAPVFGQDLNDAERATLIDAMRAQPQNYVAQEMVRVSQTPVWRNLPQPGLQASTLGLRVFACATPNGYVVMPGGLTRVATGSDARVTSMQRGSASKDTWVQTAGRVNTFSLLRTSIGSQHLLRGDTQLSSRMVENLYWFGRYAERCDNVTRLMRVALDILLNTTPEDRGGEWAAVQALCQHFDLINVEGSIADSHADNHADNGAIALLSDMEIGAALLHAVVADSGPGLSRHLQQMFQVAAHLRERLSLDNWHTLNAVVQQHARARYQPTLADAMDILNETTTSLTTLSGFALDGMTRDHGWRFLSIGRRLERLQFICTTLEHALQMPSDSNLDWLLELSNSIMTYRARYMAQPEWLPLLDLLVLDDSNPRSVIFQLEGLIKFFDRLSASYGSCGTEILQTLLTELRALQPAADLQPGNANLLAIVRKLNSASYAISEKIGQRFFSYTGEVSHRTFSA